MLHMRQWQDDDFKASRAGAVPRRKQMPILTLLTSTSVTNRGWAGSGKHTERTKVKTICDILQCVIR